MRKSGSIPYLQRSISGDYYDVSVIGLNCSIQLNRHQKIAGNLSRSFLLVSNSCKPQKYKTRRFYLWPRWTSQMIICLLHLTNFEIFYLIAEKPRRLSHCMGCGSQIHDQYILRVAPDLEWHAACLKCQECHMFLDESCTCFVKDGKTYCKRDYVK